MRIFNNSGNLGPGNPLYDYIQQIEDLTRRAADEMYNVDAYRTCGVRRVELWCATAIDYIMLDPINNPEEYAEKHDELRAKVYLRYGYAVENFVTNEVNNGNPPIPAGFNITSQEIHGSTIPDFVIRTVPDRQHRNGQTIAWLDITSSGSSGHIRRKAGGGWRNTPFVAELFYSPLTIGTVGTAGDRSIGQRARFNSAIRRNEVRKRLLDDFLRDRCNKFLNNLQTLRKTRDVPIPEIVGLVQNAFGLEIRQRNYHQIIKSLLCEYLTLGGNYPCDAQDLINIYTRHGIRRSKSDAMRYVRDAYNNSDVFYRGDRIDQLFQEMGI